MENLNIRIKEHKVIFFLVAKAASSSIKAAIKQMHGEPCGSDDILVGFDNISACDARDLKDYHKIAVVRNPWDRLVSAYYQKILGSGKSSLPNLPGIKKGMLFDDFVKAVSMLPVTRENHIRNQTIFMFCESVFVPDWIIRFENLDQEWKEVQKIMSIPDLGFRNTSDHPPYQELYTEETRALVTKRYQRDIAILGYEF